MNLDDDALNGMAGAISRGEHITVETAPGTPESVWCDVCQCESAVVVPLKGITAKAVYDLGTVTTCPRHERYGGEDE